MSVFNNRLEYQLHKIDERIAVKHPDGLPIIINGEPVTMSPEKARMMFEVAIVEGAVPCEFDGTVYRIGHFVLVPENSVR